MIEGKRGDLWLGGNDGLWRYNREGNIGPGCGVNSRHSPVYDEKSLPYKTPGVPGILNNI
jgi:hypothetical protein